LLQDFYLKFCISFWYFSYMLHLASHLSWFDHFSNTVSYLNGSNHYSLLIHLLMLDADPTDQLVPTASGKVGRSLWVIHGACWRFFMMHAYLLNTFPMGDVMRSERSSFLLHFQRGKQFTDMYIWEGLEWHIQVYTGREHEKMCWGKNGLNSPWEWRHFKGKLRPDIRGKETEFCVLLLQGCHDGIINPHILSY
jgi:hypothetical protein